MNRIFFITGRPVNFRFVERSREIRPTGISEQNKTSIESDGWAKAVGRRQSKKYPRQSIL